MPARLGDRIKRFVEKLNGFMRRPVPDQLAVVRTKLGVETKRLFGIDSYLPTDDRRVLERIIFPYFLGRDEYRDVLFVGCHWYTRGYNKWFEKKKRYWTMDSDPSQRRHGAKRHVCDTLNSLGNHFGPGSFDVIFCNGVFGWGLNAKADVEHAFEACYDCLRNGGVLVIGWNDIEQRRPFRLEECQSLRHFKPLLFPSLATSKYLTDTPNHHTYNFYIKA